MRPVSTDSAGAATIPSGINRRVGDPADAYDVVIVGGGAMGCAVAAFLFDEPAFDGRVAMVERDPT